MAYNWIENNIGIEGSDLNIWWRLAIILGIVVVAFLVDFLLDKLIIPAIRKITEKTSTNVDDILLNDKVLKSATAIIPPVILTFALPFALRGNVEILVGRLTIIYIVINVCRFVSLFIGALHAVYADKKKNRANSLKGICQTFQIIVWFIGVILIVSILIDKSPVYLIGGLGAFATVMMLIFQDSIKGLVAGIQLTLNDMVQMGDWISMPSRGVDGIVTEITLTTVKVQNFDNTIMTIQPYALITETFQNWKGMSQGGGRCISRSINVDMHSVRFCSDKEFSVWKELGYLPNDSKKTESTNLEAFRNCMESYLRSNKNINPEMTLIVRQLKTGSEGIPLQIYCFTYEKAWAKYENVQAKLIEYMIARMNEFGLYSFQRGGGTDSIVLRK